MKNIITVELDDETGQLKVTDPQSNQLFRMTPDDEMCIFSVEGGGGWWFSTTPPYEPEKHLVFSPLGMRLRLAWLILRNPLKVLDELWRQA